MAFQKFIIPTLAFAGAVVAQCDGPSITIASSTDAEQISNCRTYDGDVIIDESASGTLQINGVQQITGSLTCLNATQLTSISADQLGSIGGTFDLERLTILSGLSMGSLQAVNGIKFISLPALQSLNFGSGVRRANNVEISDTALTSLSGIELEAVTTMNINNNRYLTEVDVNNLGNVTRALTFAANSAQLKISLPNLESAANLTFINVSDVSMPSLSKVGGAFGTYFATFETFSAPNLTSTGSDLAFVSCGMLTNLSFPQLTTIGGGFLIANNSQLETIDQFPQLKTVAGALNFAGVFDKVTFPKLADVRGGADIESSTQDQTLCDDFKKAADSGIIKGDTSCKVNEANAQTNGSTTSSGGGSSSSSSSAADASLFDPSAPLTGLSALIAAILFI